MTCKWCFSVGPLVDSHVYPKAFALRSLHSGAPLVQISTRGQRHDKKRPIGSYDQIFCEACERRFGSWDTYGVNFLRSPIGQLRPILSNADACVWEVPNVDYAKLKLFVLSTLWRAHHSDLDMFATVDLDAHAVLIRAMLEHNDAGPYFAYPVQIVRYLDPPGELQLPPTKTTRDGVDVYSMQFGGHELLVHVSPALVTDEVVNAMALRPGEHVRILGGTMERLGKERQVLRFAAARRASEQRLQSGSDAPAEQ